jgi:hypothetical protein
MTVLPPQSTRFSTRQNESLREFRSAILRCEEFLPAFLQLLEPVLDASRVEKTPHQAKAVLIVFGLFTNLLNVPLEGSETSRGVISAGNTVAPRGSASAANSGAVDRDDLIRQFQSTNVISLACSVSRLVSNERFKEQAISILDFWFHLLKGTSATELVQASIRIAASALLVKEKVKAMAEARALSKSTTTTAGNTQGASIAPLVTPALLSKQRHVISSSKDPLQLSRLLEKKSLEASRGATDINRHSRFGTKLYISDGVSRQLAPTLLTAPGGKDTAPHIAKRGARASSVVGKKGSKDADDEEEDGGGLSIRRDVLTDVFRGSGSGGGVSGATGKVSGLVALDSTRDKVLVVLYEGISSLVQSVGDGGSGVGVESDMTDNLPITDIKNDEDIDETSTLPIITGFSSLVAAIKSRFTRDEGTPEDRLRYFHVTSVALGCYRAKQLGSSKKATFNASPILKCLDSWSFRNLIACLEDYISRKQWFAVETAASHLKELVLSVYAMIESGDPDSVDTGLQLYGFEMPEAQNQIPRMLKLFDPYRFRVSFSADLIESAHYLLKLADRSALEGGVRAAIDSSVGITTKKKSGKRSEEDAFTSQFIHPTVVQCYIHTLKSCLTNSDKLNYYACQFLRRLSSYPNDVAGTDPRNDHKPFTFASMLYNVSTVALVEYILSNPAILASRSCYEVVRWASEFSSSFLAATRENPLLFVEALFWRHEKGANSDVATHYGISTGYVARGDDGSADLLFGGKKKKKSKTAIAIDEAEYEARKNRLYAEQARKDREAAFGEVTGDGGVGEPRVQRFKDIDEGEAQMDFDDAEEEEKEKRRKELKKKKKQSGNENDKIEEESDVDNTRDDEVAAGTSTSNSNTDEDEGFRKRKRFHKRSSRGVKRRGGGTTLQKNKSSSSSTTRLRKVTAVSSDDDDDDDTDTDKDVEFKGTKEVEEQEENAEEGVDTLGSFTTATMLSSTGQLMIDSDNEDDEEEITEAGLRKLVAREADMKGKPSMSKVGGAKRSTLLFDDDDEDEDEDDGVIKLSKDVIMGLRRREEANKKIGDIEVQ